MKTASYEVREVPAQLALGVSFLHQPQLLDEKPVFDTTVSFIQGLAMPIPWLLRCIERHQEDKPARLILSGIGKTSQPSPRLKLSGFGKSSFGKPRQPSQQSPASQIDIGVTKPSTLQREQLRHVRWIIAEVSQRRRYHLARTQYRRSQPSVYSVCFDPPTPWSSRQKIYYETLSPGESFRQPCLQPYMKSTFTHKVVRKT